MFEMRIEIKADEIVAAMNNLAAALTGVTVVDEKPQFTFMPEDVQKVAEAPQNPVPAPAAPQVVNPMPEPVNAVPAAPVAPQMAAPVAPQPVAPAPQPVAPAPAPQPVPNATQGITYDQLFARCTAIIQGQKIQPQVLNGMLAKYGVVGMPALASRPDVMVAFWNELDSMGV